MIAVCHISYTYIIHGIDQGKKNPPSIGYVHKNVIPKVDFLLYPCSRCSRRDLVAVDFIDGSREFQQENFQCDYILVDFPIVSFGGGGGHTASSNKSNGIWSLVHGRKFSGPKRLVSDLIL